MTPTIQLGRLAAVKRSPFREDLHVVETRRLSCSPKGFWSSWREDILKPSHDWRESAREMLIQAMVKTPAGRTQVRVLVDTGAKVPLVFRKDLLPKPCLKKACYPVHFLTVDGQRMEGGTHGQFMELWLPIYRNERLITARTCALFAYEADIKDIDIIMGYPFLKAFKLSVDAEHDCL